MCQFARAIDSIILLTIIELDDDHHNQDIEALTGQGRTLLDFIILTLEFIYREVVDDGTIILSLW